MDTAARTLERFASQMHSTARRWSASHHDAEDACQRAAEILLTREPACHDADLCRWLRTTVKREALAIREHGTRVLALGPPDRLPLDRANPADTEWRAERLERLRESARGLRDLKAQERRCLLLRAQGYSYAEIQEHTGFSYTNVWGTIGPRASGWLHPRVAGAREVR